MEVVDDSDDGVANGLRHAARRGIPLSTWNHIHCNTREAQVTIQCNTHARVDQEMQKGGLLTLP